MPELLSRQEIQQLLPQRPREGHKGTFGHLFVLAGSRRFSGAVKLTCDGAMRSGVGLTTAGVPAPLADTLAAAFVEPMLLPLPVTDSGSIACEAADIVTDFAADKSAMVVGPGLSQDPSTMRLARRLALERALPLLLDADGLNAFAAQRTRLALRDAATTADAVFTPHPGEMARLTGMTTKEIQQNRAAAATKYAPLWRATVVLKGAATIIAAPDGRIRQNPTGNPGMATGGAGDVLSGVIGALLAQGLEAFDAACIGVYVHGLAGDIAAREKSERGLIARDIIEALPGAWRAIEDAKP